MKRAALTIAAVLVAALAPLGFSAAPAGAAEEIPQTYHCGQKAAWVKSATDHNRSVRVTTWVAEAKGGVLVCAKAVDLKKAPGRVVLSVESAGTEGNVCTWGGGRNVARVLAFVPDGQTYSVAVGMVRKVNRPVGVTAWHA